MNYAIVGSLMGFGYFVLNLILVDDVFYRPNIFGRKIFTMKGFLDYLKAPLQIGSHNFKTLWGLTPNIKITDRLNMLQLNWIAMTGFGSLTGLLFNMYKS